MSLHDGQLTPDEFEAIALEHGALPAFRYYEDPDVACDGPDQETWEGVFVQGKRVPAKIPGAPDQICIAIDHDIVLTGAADFEEMLEGNGSPVFDVYVPKEDLVGAPGRLAELQELAYELGGAVGLRSFDGGLLFQPIIVRVQCGPLDGMTRLSFAAEQVVLRDDHFAQLLDGLIPPE